MTSFYYKVKLQRPLADECDSGYVTTESSVCSDSYRPSTSSPPPVVPSAPPAPPSAPRRHSGAPAPTTAATTAMARDDAAAAPAAVDAELLAGIDKRLAAKWHRAFHVFFDINKDKVLEWDDFELLIGTIKQSRGEDSRDYQTAKNAMESIWHSLLEASDVDKDRKVTMDEWKHMWYASIKDDTQARWQQLYLEYMFRLFDSTGDDLIDLSEYIEVMGYYGVSREEATWAFDHFAVSDEGRQLNAITFDTYIKLWKEYFKSTDAKARGNYLLGDVSGEFDASTYVAA